MARKKVVDQDPVAEQEVEAGVVLPEGEGYVPITQEQADLAQRLGVLAGFDPVTMTGLISKEQDNA